MCITQYISEIYMKDQTIVNLFSFKTAKNKNMT